MCHACPAASNGLVLMADFMADFGGAGEAACGKKLAACKKANIVLE